MIGRPRQAEGPPKELKERARRISRVLRATYKDSTTALHFNTPFELLVATILSAQCTDDKVNQVTPALFACCPDPASLAAIGDVKLEGLIHSTGFYRQKARNLKGCAKALVEMHDGVLPESIEALTSLPGVGRKTANLVRACAMGKPGIIVDTHFKRIVGRLGLTAETNPDKIEADIAALLPDSHWTEFSNALIWHGRALCPARTPQCERCPVREYCDFGQDRTN